MYTNLNALPAARRERIVAVPNSMSRNVQRCARTLKGAATVAGAVALSILFYACTSSPSAAQEAGSPNAMTASPRSDAPDGPGGHGPRHGRGPRGDFRGGMGGDAAARLLDNQTALQLSGSQVTRLIALHKSAVNAAKPLQQQLMTMFQSTRRDSASSGSQRSARPRPTPAQRDSAMTIMEQLREQRWRNTSAADSVLTADQRKVAAQLFGRGGGRGR